MTNKVNNDVELNRKKANKRILKGCLLGGLSMSLLFAEVVMATNLSGLTGEWKKEAGSIVPTILLIIAGIGVIIAAIAVISGIMAKKNQEPLRWQLWGVIGGALAVIIPVLVLATAGSLAGGQGGADTTMGSLNIQR